MGFFGVLIMIAIFAPMFAAQGSSSTDHHCHLQEFEEPERRDVHGIVVEADCKSLDPFIDRWRPYAEKANTSEWEYSNAEIAEKLDLTEGQVKYLLRRMLERGLIECQTIFRENCWYTKKYIGGDRSDQR
jgi:hypothetical protein